jgi:hypothetical protein
VSRESSKPAIASVARSYVQTVNHTARNAKAGLEFKLSPKELASALEGISTDVVQVYELTAFHRSAWATIAGLHDRTSYHSATE